MSRLGECVGVGFSTSRGLTGVFVDNRVSGFAGRCHANRLCFALGSSSTTMETIVFGSSTGELGFVPRSKVGIVTQNEIDICRTSKRCRLCISSVRPSNINTLGLTCRRLGRGLRGRKLFSRRRGGPLPPCPRGIKIVASPANTTIHSVVGILNEHFPCTRVIFYPILIRNSNTRLRLASTIGVFGSRETTSIVVVNENNNSVRSL